MTANLPLLYKYLHPDKAAERFPIFTRSGIQLRATPPDEFNDPFELACDLYDEKEKAIVHKIQKQELPGDFLAATTRGILKHSSFIDHFDIASRWLRAREQVSSDLGLLCLSACWDSILMWSHYADEHRGFAVGIDTGHPDVPLSFFPVEYSATRPRSIPIQRNPTEKSFTFKQSAMESAIFTKSSHWRYEHEWRGVTALNKKDAVTLIDIPASAVLIIMLGWRNEGPLLDSIIDAIRHWPTKPLLTTLIPHWTEYRLDMAGLIPAETTVSQADTEKDSVEHFLRVADRIGRGTSIYLANQSTG